MKWSVAAVAVILLISTLPLVQSRAVEEHVDMEEGSLTAPRAQVYSYLYSCLAWVPQLVVGFLMAAFGGFFTGVWGVIYVLIAIFGGILYFLAAFIGALLVAAGIFPWVWETFIAVISGAFPVLVAVSASLALALGCFGCLSFIPGPPNFIIGLSVLVIALIFWVLAIIVALIAGVLWVLPYATSALFSGAAVIWLLAGFVMGLVAYAGQAIILGSSILYGLFLFVGGAVLAFFLALLAYGIESMLGPLNLIITVSCSILGLFSFIPCILSACLSFFGLGCLTACTQSLSWCWNYVVLTLIDVGGGLGGLCALEGPINLIVGMIGLGMVFLGLLLSITLIGFPVGIPMMIFGSIIMARGFIVGGPGCIVACVVQFPGIQNLVALLVLIPYLISSIPYVGWVYLVFEGLVYVLDFVIGLPNALAWFLWISCTSIFCISALCPWGWAVSSGICSLPALPCYAFGCMQDLCSWAFLTVQNALFYLWRLFFQSSMD